MNLFEVNLAVQPCEAQSGTSISGFAAGFYFALRTIFVFVTARWFNRGTEAGVALSFLIGAFLVIIGLLQSVGRKPNHPAKMTRTAIGRWVLLYLAFSGASLIWTASSAPLSSAVYWIFLTADVAIVALILPGDPANAASSILKGYVAASCALAATAWCLPRAADLRLGDLDYFNTNQIANVCALSLLVIPFGWRHTSVPCRVASVLLAITLLRSLSKATLVAFVVAQAYRLLCDRTMKRSRKILMIAAAATLALCFSTLIEDYFTGYTSAGNQAETLTGRTAIWAWTLRAAMEHSWFGNGFDAMWKVAPPFGGELFEARHAENELLQQFFAYGVAGVVLLAGLYTSLYRLARRIPNSTHRSALTALVLFAVVRGLAEAEPFDLLLPLWLMTTLAALAAHHAIAAPLRVRLHSDAPRPQCKSLKEAAL